MSRHTNPNYDKFPSINVNEFTHEAWKGMSDISDALNTKINALNQEKTILVVDMYHGVYEDDLIHKFLQILNCQHVFSVSVANHSEKIISDMLTDNITDDRVFGILSCHKISQFFDVEKIHALNDSINAVQSGLVLVYGIGASHVVDGDILVYADMARWEIQQRMRKQRIANWCTSNYELDYMRRYKRAFFIDWRVLDRHKQTIYNKIDFLLDTNDEHNFKMITGDAFLYGLKKASTQPFRLVPFFDPGPWGGQWMKDVCDLDSSKENFAWCFDCVPEENSLYLKFNDITLEVPSINLVFLHPKQLLGPKVYARFGKEFPIRFDFLDTVDGGNLSLQVHPLTEYIQNTFGMHYTQDESYYILDAKEDATVYLGLKDNIKPERMINALNTAQEGQEPFNADEYINSFPAKKHDHFLIPAGTIHCSGKNAMVLEISATPYIFTFKLWDWGRLGLDGIPRPIHLEHGKNVIQWDRTTTWVEENLCSPVEKISEHNGITEERTGLHELEFIETRRHWFDKEVLHNTHGSVNVLNLVEGVEAIVESPTNAFDPFIVHYAETFIIPECINEYTIRPYGQSHGQKIATIKAYVRV